MLITVISEDPGLEELCQQTLQGLSLEQVNLRLLLPPEEPEGEVRIWEYDPASFPKRLTSDQVGRSLFILDAWQLTHFRARLGTLRASIVLKPVLGPALRPFLEHSLQARRAPDFLGNQDDWNLLEGLLDANFKLQQCDPWQDQLLDAYPA